MGTELRQVLEAFLSVGGAATVDRSQQRRPPQPALTGDEDGVEAPTTAPTTAPSASAMPQPLRQQEQLGSVATVCTALRVLESMAARAQVFTLSGRLVSNMVHAVAVTWVACGAWPAAGPAGPAAALHAGSCGGSLGGGSQSVSGGAALFTSSCALLLAILRHRQEVGRARTARGLSKGTHLEQSGVFLNALDIFSSPIVVEGSHAPWTG